MPGRSMVDATPSISSQHFPVPLTPLIGREREIAAVQGLLTQSSVRAVTLTGPGGVGKTRLALAVAERLGDAFPDGTYFVSLAPLSESRTVVSAIAAALSIAEQPGIPLRDLVAAQIGGRRLLLLLDNFEHVIEAAGGIADLLAACPNLTVLATSRTPLHIYGEHEYQVPPLGLPDKDIPASARAVARNEAVALFVHRAQAVQRDFALTDENAAAVTEICRKLDGLPLAIELAAARNRMFPPRDLATRLEHPLGLLIGGPRGLPDRHRTLRNTIAWSYDLLRDDEQALFRALSVCRGGWTLEAAEVIPDQDGGVLDGLNALIEHSLVRRIEQPDGTARYSMLETIREYALEQLADSGGSEDAHRRHAVHYLPWAAFWGRELSGGEQTRIILLLESEIDNIRAAFGWALSHDEPDQPLLDAALRAMGWLFLYWLARGRVSEGRRWLKAALIKSGASELARAMALDGAGALAAEQGDFEQAITWHEESLAIALDEQDGYQQAIALWGLARVAGWSGDLERAVAAYEEGIALTRRRGEWGQLAGFLGNYGSMLGRSGEIGRGLSVLEEAAALYRETFGHEHAVMLNDLGHVTMLHGDLDRARAMLATSLGIERVRGPSRLIADSLEEFAYLAVLERQPVRAARLLGACEALRQKVGAPVRPSRLQSYQHILDQGRAQLLERDWDSAWAEGRVMLLDDAIDYALTVDQSPEPCATPEPSLLSKRETEVLRLVIEGRSNKEIAEALFISPRTVAQHLRSIYTKLDVDSRTAAATWAVRHGLV